MIYDNTESTIIAAGRIASPLDEGNMTHRRPRKVPA